MLFFDGLLADLRTFLYSLEIRMRVAVVMVVVVVVFVIMVMILRAERKEKPGLTRKLSRR